MQQAMYKFHKILHNFRTNDKIYRFSKNSVTSIDKQ